MARISKWQNLLRRFGASQKGSVAIMFALSAIPVLLAVGASVDFVRYTALSTELQSALDAAALSAAASTDSPDSQRVALAKATFMENANNGEISKATVDFKIKGGAVLASAKYEMPTTFMRLASVDAMQIPAITEVSIPEGKTAEIALVLDYSGSMKDSIAGGTKYVAMRNATKKLINDLKKANPKKVKFALVPFSHHVYVTLPKAYVLGQKGVGSWTGCTQDRPFPANLTDDTPNSNDNTKWGQPQAPEHAAYGCNGYKIHDLRLAPLTDDFDGLKSQLDSMTPYQYTPIALGVEFGFHVLSDNAPFTSAVGYSDKKTQKIMIVLTDGAQTEPAFGPAGARTKEDGENNLEALCENAKAKGITMMTIAYDLDDSTTRNRLRDCSTDPAKHFFVATDTSAVASAFDNIRNAITAQVFVSR
jgi:Flp pilus assembly protein TadG